MKKELEELGKRMIAPDLLKDAIVQVGTAFEVITNTARDFEVDLSFSSHPRQDRS